MQVYRRIANPTMPQGTANLTNAPDTSTTPFPTPGEIGCAFFDPMTGREHLRVKADSGATSATPIGAIAAGQVAFWKDRAANLVTNDKRFCDVGPSGAINRAAGIFPLAVTAGYVCDVVINARGANVMNVASDGTALAGAQATVDTTAATARVIYTTGVNTAPVSQVVGVMTTGVVANNLTPVEVSLGFSI